MTISTSVWHGQHPNAGRNIQHAGNKLGTVLNFSLSKCNFFWVYMKKNEDSSKAINKHDVEVVGAEDLSPCEENPACCKVFFKNSSKSLISVSGSQGGSRVVVVDVCA